IVAPFEPHLPTFPGRGVRARRDQVVVGDDLRLDEATFDIAVDHARCLGRFRALTDGPGPDLGITGREERDEVQQTVGGVDEGREGGFFYTRVFEVCSTL